MINIVLISENERERNILNIALEQRGVKVLLSESKYQNYVYVMQFMPDIIIIELPHFSVEQVSFAQRIRTFKRTRSIPIIGYGDKVSQSIVNGIIKSGISIYLERPLKFSVLIQRIEHYLKMQKKSLEAKPAISEKEQDMALLLNSDIIGSQKIEVMVRHVVKLVAFPFTIAKVLKITQSEGTGATELSKAVSADPYMATYILKVSNSVFFATANRRISSVKEAIVRIGFNETKRIVLGMTVMNLFEKTNKNSGFDRIDFWYHSLATAIFSERIAKNIGDINLEEAFLAGLLHDLGIILLDDCFAPVFDTLLNATSKDADLFINQEKKILKVTHLDMLAELFPKWRIPQNVTDAILYQYEVPHYKGEADTPEKKLATCIAIGNAAAKLLHIGKECDEFVEPFSDAIFKQAKLPSGITTAFVNSSKEQIELYREFLSLEKRDYKCDCPDGVDPGEVVVGLYNAGNSLFVPPKLFFEQRTITCKPISQEESLDTCHDKFHIIICWANKSMSSASIAPLETIRKNQKNLTDAPTVAEEQLFAPLILLAPQEDEDAKETYGQTTLVLENRLDYRLLESKICGLLLPHHAMEKDEVAPKA